MACQLGKYDTFTSTGVPILETWKLTVLSVSHDLGDMGLGHGRRGGERIPDRPPGATTAGPLWARKTFQRDGLSYQLSDGGSHDVWAAPDAHLHRGIVGQARHQRRVQDLVDLPRRRRRDPAWLDVHGPVSATCRRRGRRRRPLGPGGSTP